MKKARVITAVVIGMIAALLALSACGSADKLDVNASAGPMKYMVSSKWISETDANDDLPIIGSHARSYVKKNGDDISLFVNVSVYDYKERNENNRFIPAKYAKSPEEQKDEDARITDEMGAYNSYTYEEIGTSSIAGASVKIYKEVGTHDKGTSEMYEAFIQFQPYVEASISTGDKATLEAIIATISFE